jgi:hypothetical protein
LIIGLLLFDLGAFEWSPQNKIETARTGTDHLDLLLSCRGAAEFLKSRPGVFRVQAPGDNGPNLGDVYELRTIQGGAVTMLKDYMPFYAGHRDLLNVRYILKPASSQEPGAIYQDASWKVYEDPKAFPAAWLVHNTITEPSRERLFARLDDPAVDPHRTALLDRPLGAALDPPIANAPEEARFVAYQADKLELAVHAQSRGLLVLSENFYPGWRATVNGAYAPIHKVDGGLRGIVVPRGESRIVMQYAPWTVFAGALLTLLAFAGTLLAAALDWRARRSKPAREVEAGAC